METTKFVEALVSNTTGFFAREVFYHYKAEAIKKPIMDIISKIAMDRFRILIASLFFVEANTLLSSLVIFCIGGMVYFTAMEMVQTIIHIAKRLFFAQKNDHPISFVATLKLQIVSYSIYFVSLTAWAKATSKITQSILQFTFIHIKNCRDSFFGYSLDSISKIFISKTPFFCGEIIGTILGTFTYECLLKREKGKW